jgi:hypothetical protein
MLFRGQGTMKLQCCPRQPTGSFVNLYITKLWVAFVQCGTIKSQFSSREPEQKRPIFHPASRTAPDKKKSLNMKYIWNCYGTIKVQCSANHPKSSCQFVYGGSLDAISSRGNNGDSIFGSLGHEPAIQKLPKSVMFRQPGLSPPGNLYIAEAWVVYVGEGTIETLFSTR